MAAAVQTGYLVVADIPGYTSAEIEGGAVFVYSPQERIPPRETLLE